jgi:hypothetical protein
MRLLLLCAVLFAGCYSEMAVVEGEKAPDDSKAYFYLKNGSYVRSFADRHSRVDSGYQVKGDLYIKGQFDKHFEGIVNDSEIEKTTLEEFRWEMAIVYGVAVGVAVWLSMRTVVYAD